MGQGEAAAAQPERSRGEPKKAGSCASGHGCLKRSSRVSSLRLAPLRQSFVHRPAWTHKHVQLTIYLPSYKITAQIACMPGDALTRIRRYGVCCRVTFACFLCSVLSTRFLSTPTRKIDKRASFVQQCLQLSARRSFDGLRLRRHLLHLAKVITAKSIHDRPL
jgi:hypothetical protein